MRNFWLVARREFVERGRMGSYLITTLFMMAVMLFTTLAPVIFDNKNSTTKPMDVVLLDKTGQVADPLKQALAAIQAAKVQGMRPVNLTVTQEDENALIERARKSNFAALIVDGTFPDGVKARFLTTSAGLLNASGNVTGPLTELVRSARVQKLGLDAAGAQAIIKPMESEEKQLSSGSGERDQNAFAVSMLAAMGAVLMNYMVTLLNSQFVFQGVLEEKMSRVMEVMAAAVSPTEMMAGKIAGLGGLGLVQFTGFMAAWYGGNAWGRTISDAVPSGIPTNLLVLTLVYLVLGFIMNAALMAAGASMLSRMEDAQTVQMPLMLILVIPMMLLSPVMMNPNGSLAVVLSFIPFFTPTMMLLRVALGDVPLWQILTSIGLMLVTTLLMVRLSARVYRAAMLSYGGRPTMKQVWSYLRAG